MASVGLIYATDVKKMLPRKMSEREKLILYK